MYIIDGKYKNKKIITETKKLKLDHNLIRPTTTKTRAAIFNVLYNYFDGTSCDLLQGKKVLDLCCGIGSFGLEALSRGAYVTFIDNYLKHIAILKMNISALQVEADSEVIVANAARLKSSTTTYDLVYVDPPYKSELYQAVLEQLYVGNWLNKKSIIVMEMNTRYAAKIYDERFKVLNSKQYGATSVVFYSLNA